MNFKINISNLDKKKFLMVTALSFAVFALSSTLAFAALTLSATTITSDGALTLSPATNLIINGNVGIDTASPSSILDILSNGNSDQLVKISNLTVGSSADAGFQANADVAQGSMGVFSSGYTGVPGYANAVAFIGGGTEAVTILGSLADAGYLRFDTGGPIERMRLTSDGNLGIGTAAPNANAILDITSTTKAFMPPRMTTTQRNAIPSPTAGMVIYNSTTNKLNVYTTTWEAFTSS